MRSTPILLLVACANANSSPPIPAPAVAVAKPPSLVELSSKIPAPLGGYAFALHPSTLAPALSSDTSVSFGASMTLVHVEEGETPMSVVSRSIVTAEMRYVVPNATLIPIPPGTKPAVGDFVRVAGTPDPLNPYIHEPSFGYGIVTSVREGEPATYRRLDSGRNRTPSPQDERPLPDYFFLVLTGAPWEPGSHVAYRDDKWTLATLLYVHDDDVVLLGGHVVVAKKSQVRLLPLRPTVKPGDRVYSLEERDDDGTEVITVDAKRGLVAVRGRKDTHWLPFGTFSLTPVR